MGYDMYTVTKDPDEEAAVADIRTRMSAASREQRQADWEQLREELHKTQRSYFRLNIWGMGAARELMYDAGMLDTETVERTWPDSDTFGITDAMWDDWDGEPDENTPAELLTYHKACQAVTDAQREKPTGIPLHKLNSNDGWLVTPDEIAAALERYVLGDGVTANAPVWWADWIAWLRYAQEHGGFRVR